MLITALGPALSGCAGRRVAPLPEVNISPRKPPSGRLHASIPGDQTLTVTARIEIKSHGERHLLKAALMMKRPAHLRLESIPLLGPPDFFLSIDAGEIRVFIPGKEGNLLRRSGHRGESFPILPPGPAGGRDGFPPDGPLPENGGDGFFIVARGMGGWLYRVDQYRSGGKILSLWIDPSGDLLRRIRAFTEGGNIAYTAEFAEHVRCGKGFPAATVDDHQGGRIAGGPLHGDPPGQ